MNVEIELRKRAISLTIRYAKITNQWNDFLQLNIDVDFARLFFQ